MFGGVITMAMTFSKKDAPAVLGGAQAFPAGLPFVRPAVPDPDVVAGEVSKILRSGVLTNGPYVQELETRVAEYLGVRNCVAVSSCTAGLMLVLRALDLTGDVVLPSFTFSATAHAVAWNGLRPAFADIDPATLTLSPEAVERGIGSRTSTILATHTFGTPCDVEALAEAAHHHGLRLVFDAAHAFGSCRRGIKVGGFGDAEVFSLSVTKVLVAGEGGIIATNDDSLAERCRIGRDYGNPGDYDCRFVGLNARMSELHAAVALGSLAGLDGRLRRRSELAALYHEVLSPIPGIGFPAVAEGDSSVYKDFTILVDPEDFGLDAPQLAAALAAEGIDTRRYYVPPVHTQRAYRVSGHNGDLPVTDAAAAKVLSLPFWSGLSDDQLGRVAAAVKRIRTHLGTDSRPAAPHIPVLVNLRPSGEDPRPATPSRDRPAASAAGVEGSPTLAPAHEPDVVIDLSDDALMGVRRAATAVAQLSMHLRRVAACVSELAGAVDEEADPAAAHQLRSAAATLRRILVDDAEAAVSSARAIADRALDRAERRP